MASDPLEEAQRDIASLRQQLAAAEQQIAEFQTTILNLQEQLRLATGH